MRTSVDHRFPSGDPVCEYWLAHSEGFTVLSPRGRRAGWVADVVLDASAESVSSLVVRRRLRRVAMPAGRVAAVIPARRTLVLAPAVREPRVRPSRSSSAGARRAAAGRTLGRVATGTRRGGRRFSTAAGAHGRSALAAAAVADRHLEAVLAPAARRLAVRAVAGAEVAARRLAVGAAAVGGAFLCLAGETLAAARRALEGPPLEDSQRPRDRRAERAPRA